MKSGWEMTDNKFFSYYLGCIEFQSLYYFKRNFKTVDSIILTELFLLYFQIVVTL